MLRGGRQVRVTMIICVGEILADMIGREENGTVCYERYAGGAPFNVACGLKKLGISCGFCGSVGADIIGDFLKEFAEKQQFEYLYIGRKTQYNTTLAFVELAYTGERRFSFYRKHTADYCLPHVAVQGIAEQADIVHIGSLLLSEKRGLGFADRLISAAHVKGKLVSFDVNYREDIFTNKEEAVNILSKYIMLADIVKLSEEELPLFTGEKTLEEGLCLLAGNNKTVFLTLGAEGSMACANGKIYYAPSVSVKAFDTTGAGDAFFAGVLAAMHDGATDLSRVLRQGNICGAFTVIQKGAYPRWSRKDIMKASRDLYISG